MNYVRNKAMTFKDNELCNEEILIIAFGPDNAFVVGNYILKIQTEGLNVPEKTIYILSLHLKIYVLASNNFIKKQKRD